MRTRFTLPLVLKEISLLKTDKKLDFSDHISNLCKKVSLKLDMLARISQYISADKL